MAALGREKEGRVRGLRDLVGRKGGLWVELTGRWMVVGGLLAVVVVVVEVVGRLLVEVVGRLLVEGVGLLLVEVRWLAGAVAVEILGCGTGLAASEARTREMLEGRDGGCLAWGGAADGAVAGVRLASSFAGMAVDLAIDGRPAGSFFEGVFAGVFAGVFTDGMVISFEADFASGVLISFNADFNIATFFSFKADFGVVALVWPPTILLDLLFTGDGAATDGAADTAGRHSPTSSMASSRASIASTESSIRVTDLAGDLATIFSTKESSLWWLVVSSFCWLSNVSVRVILAGVRDPMVPTNESS